MTATPRLDTVFAAAIDLPHPADRAAYIARACGADAELRAKVEVLVAAHFQAGSFLDEPAPELAATIDQPAPDGPGTVIGPYRLMEQVGEGGMGVVFVAEQQHPVRRKVALKLIKPGMDTREVIARFEAERQALALMDHPHIARVLDAGVTDRGRPYFVMELVRGIPVTEYCDRARLGVRERLGLFVQVCQAVQHAHQKGVIHRDLKPSNVLVTEHDGTPVAKVIDFGVAKAVGQSLTDKTVYTRHMQLVGSPMYMSPEQAGLSGLDVDTRADIYALGVLLYELLTGTTPFDKERFRTAGYDEVRQIIREEEPPKPSTRLSTLGRAAVTVSANRQSEPRKLSALVRGELDWLVMKALEKDRNRRYESAAAFAHDVQRYLADEPVQACPPSAVYRFHKFARRNRGGVLTGAGAALALLLAVGSALVVQAANTAEIQAQQRDTKDALDRETAANLDYARALAREARVGYFRGIALAERELAAGNVGRAEELLEECPAPLRGWEWHHLKRRPYGPLVFREHSSGVWNMAFSPDGHLIASAGVKLQYGEFIIWDRRTGAVRLRRLAHHGPIEGLAFSPDGRHLVTGSWDKSIKVWDAATGEELHTLQGHGEYIRCVAFSPDGRFLATAGGDQTILVWDGRTFQKLHPLKGHTGGVFSIAFGPGGRLASASTDGTVRVWDAATGAEEHVLRGHAGPALAVAFLGDGTRLASGGFDGTARVWDPRTGRQLMSLAIDTVATTCVAFNHDGTRLAAGSLEKSVRVWDLEARQEAVTLSGHDPASPPWDGVMAVAFSPDGRQLASANLDGTVRVWDSSPVTTGPRAVPLWGHAGAVFGVAVQPGGAGRAGLVASASLDETVKLWDPATGQLLRTQTGHAGPVARVAFSRDGRRMVSADYTSVAKVWDAATFKEVRTFRAFGGVISLSPDGRQVAYTAEGTWVHIRDVDTGEEVIPPFRAHDVPCFTLTFTPDGRHVATGSWDGTVKVWEVATGRMVRKFEKNGIISWLAFSDDGTRLATGSWDKTVKVWDATTGKGLRTLVGHKHRVVGVAFSPDGRHVASASQDNTVRVWETATGKEVAVLHGHIGYVMGVAYSADGKWLVSCGGYRAKGDVRIWDTAQWERKAGGK